MAAVPPTASNTAQSIQPVFKRVQQKTDHDCAFACIAMICGKSLEEIVQVAVTLGHPAHGPYWISENLIAKILIKFGLVATVYKEIVKGIIDMPDVAICMVDYDAETEIGRHVVFVRDQSNLKQIKTYMLDPAYWLEKEFHVRNDFPTLKPAWYIGLHPARQATKNGK